MSQQYPDRESDITVTYIDGEVQTFRITASNGIAHHLMNEAARTGVLVVRNDKEKKSYCIPIGQVRNVEIQTVNVVEK